MEQSRTPSPGERVGSKNNAALKFFCDSFIALTGGKSPFPWQERAFQQLVRGLIPPAVALPTGTGKTSLIPIWLIALAWQARTGQVSLPRRLVWVVNRRVVVDQATEEAQTLVSRLASADHNDLHEVHSPLAQLSFLGSRGTPVAVSTLRGEYADNGDWKLDPSRPAIIVGTVDMVGSRLLFAGYGDGPSKRALHAGLLGQDALIVLDEAHLTPPFAALLSDIQKMQQVSQHPRPLRVSVLSATQRESGVPQGIQIEGDDESDPVIGRRLKAKKALHVHRLNERERPASKLATLALVHAGERVRVLVYVRSPRTAEEVRQHIDAATPACEVRVLTGTQRGFERDQLAGDPVFVGFRSNPHRSAPEATHYLISTSAGEVGADLDADHLVCDLTSIDSMIQRFGRVNRLGLGKARLDAVVPATLVDEREEATLDYLEALPSAPGGGRNVSPHVLSTHPPPVAAFSEAPRIVPLSHHWLDMWALTSISDMDWPDRPEIAPWLHGVEAATPETWVAWRSDVEWLARETVREHDCQRALDACPVLTHERLREPRAAIIDKLVALAERDGNAAHRVLVIRADESLWRGTLDQLTRFDPRQLHFATVLLPTDIGGLSPQGLFAPDCSDPARDVVEQGAGTGRRRLLLEQEGNRWTAHPLADTSGNGISHEGKDFNAVTDALAGTTGLMLMEAVQIGGPGENEDQAKSLWLLYFAISASAVDSAAVSLISRQAEGLPAHLQRVAKLARRLAESTAVADLVPTFEWAGRTHDQGKDRPCWQRAIGNRDPRQPLAKTGHARFNYALNGGYRHEFGSLLDAAMDAGLAEQPWRDVALHLIASHHGHGRPHFDERALDREVALDINRQTALESMQRFARLQARYGWWGLAWLEALLKAADGIASAGLDEGVPA